MILADLLPKEHLFRTIEQYIVIALADATFSPERNIGSVVLLNAESTGINKLTTQFWKMVLKI